MVGSFLSLSPTPFPPQECVRRTPSRVAGTHHPGLPPLVLVVQWPAGVSQTSLPGGTRTALDETGRTTGRAAVTNHRARRARETDGRGRKPPRAGGERRSNSRDGVDTAPAREAEEDLRNAGGEGGCGPSRRPREGLSSLSRGGPSGRPRSGPGGSRRAGVVPMRSDRCRTLTLLRDRPGGASLYSRTSRLAAARAVPRRSGQTCSRAEARARRTPTPRSPPCPSEKDRGCAAGARPRLGEHGAPLDRVRRASGVGELRTKSAPRPRVPRGSRGRGGGARPRGATSCPPPARRDVDPRKSRRPTERKPESRATLTSASPRGRRHRPRGPGAFSLDRGGARAFAFFDHPTTPRSRLAPAG